MPISNEMDALLSRMEKSGESEAMEMAELIRDALSCCPEDEANDAYVETMADQFISWATELVKVAVKDKPAQPAARYVMHVETDDDFAIELGGRAYTSSEFDVLIRDVTELDDIKILGPWGTPYNSHVKSQEFEYAISEIKKNPEEYFSNLGGNRGVSWTPFKAENTDG